MKNRSSKPVASHRVTMSLLAGVVIMGLAQAAGAFGTTGSAGSLTGEQCAFSVQLQKSVSAQREYLVKVEEAIGATTYTVSNSVEDMYGNIVPASYNEDDSYDAGSLSLLFSSPKTTGKKVNNLDAFSVDCMSCHDGVTASSIQVELRDRPLDRVSRVNSFTSDHPVGMTYDNYVAANRGYKPIGGNTKMIFVDGKVGCLTCHDPLNPEKGHLVMSDRNSALCQTCHDK